MIETWSQEQTEAFGRDGFLIAEEGFIDDAAVEALRERFDRLFAGDYETGIRPDEVNWVAGRDPEDRTRQICNGWKADRAVAAQVLSERTGRLAAELMGWDGVRIVQDNVIWKPPGTKSLGMHQDGSYLDYLVPPEMVTVWVALDDTSAEAGTMTYAAGSHHWPRSPENRGEFHAPPDWLAPLERALPAGEELAPGTRSRCRPAALRSTTTTRSTVPARTPARCTGVRSSPTSCATTPSSIPSTST